MGGLTSAVHWWEEWQLRVLVLTSLGVQFLLLVFSCMRRMAIPGLLRFIMWLAYLAGDAVAIYALATLFNRHKADRNGNMLEVVWAPVLLLHLGGHDGITAYNIEDNELWTRHLLTAVSQVTVAIYVFCKSWPTGGDKRLLQAAILLFVPGVLKCFHKPWALKRASFYSLVSSAATAKQNKNEGGEMYYSLEEYVKRAKDFVAAFVPEQKDDGGEAQEANASGGRSRASPPAEDGDHPPSSQRGNPTQDDHQRRREALMKRIEGNGEASKLFVDHSSPYPRRLNILQQFWELSEERAYGSLRRGLATAFLLLYTKLKTAGLVTAGDMLRPSISRLVQLLCRQWIVLSRMALPWAAIAAFHQSHREAYTHTDVKITYVLFCCTAVIEAYSFIPLMAAMNLDEDDDDDDDDDDVVSFFFRMEDWPEMVTQYSLIGYFARNKKHSWWMWIASLVGCKDFLDQHWCMSSRFSSRSITKLVLGYLKDGWTEEIKDAASYRRFNDHNTHWVLDWSNQGQGLRRPFDECVLLWHLATEFCFFLSFDVLEHRCVIAEGPTVWMQLRAEGRERLETKGARGTRSSIIDSARTGSSRCGEGLTACKAVLCRQMSNYMVYLLFINPEMLLPGSRRNLFTSAHEELKAIFKDEKPPLEKKRLIMKISTKIDSSQDSLETFIHDAWMIAKDLRLKGKRGMWEEIQRVWVEMLCFSASRCRGYLHAKALGKGGEFLSYVGLLLFHMGMETFTDKLQREEHPPPHRIVRSAPASPHRPERYRIAAEYMV